MPIYKRPSKKNKKKYVWFIDITLSNGTRIRKSSKTDDRQKAERLHDKLKSESWDLTNFEKKPEYYWEELVTEYLNERGHLASPDYAIKNIKFLNKYLTGVHLSAIDKNMVKHITNERIKSTFQRKKNGIKYKVTVTTVNHTLTVLKAILNEALKELKWIKKLPEIKKIKKHRTEEIRKVWLTKTEANRLIKELPTHLKALVRFSLATGLRHANVTQLTWSAINFKDKTATFFGDEVKNGEDMTTLLNDNAIAVLLKEKGKHPTRVFTYKGKPVKSANTKAWRKALDRAGIAPYIPSDDIKDSKIYPTKDLDQYKYRQFRYHDLRHTWASWHAQNGTPLIVLQELGGWKVFDMVNRYAHFNKKHLSVYANNSHNLSDEDEDEE